MTVKFQQLQEKIVEQKIAPVYLIQGTDVYLLQQAEQLFIQLVPENQQAMNFARYDMHEQALAVALDDARSIPFFGERRVVIIENAYFLTGERVKSKIEHHPEELIDYLKHPEPQTVLVIMAPYEKLDRRKKVTKILQEQSEHVSFGNLTERDLQSFVQTKLAEQHMEIDSGGMETLIRLTGANLSTMMSEIDKLVLYVLPAQQITALDVEQVVTKNLTDNVFDLIDDVLKLNFKAALELYHQLLLNGEEPLRVQGALTSQFRLLLQVKAAKTSEKGTATALKVHPYRVKLARQTVRRFNYRQLAKAFLGLVKMEQQIKTTSRDPELLFELFILDYQHAVKPRH